MTTHAPLRPPAIAEPRRPARSRLDRETLAFAAAAIVLAVCLGIGASAKPVQTAGLAALAAAVAAFVRWPLAVLLGVMLVRASLQIEGNLGYIGLAVALGGGVALLLVRPRQIPRVTSVPLLAFLVLALISLAWTPELDDSFRSWLRLSLLAVVLFIAGWAVSDMGRLRALSIVVLLAALVPIGVGFFQLATGDFNTRQGFDAIDGTFTFANGYAYFLMIVLTVGVVVLMESRALLARLATTALLSLAAIAFVLTYARSAWLGLAVVLVLLAVFQYRRMGAVAAVGVLAAALAIPSGLGVVGERFSDLSSSSGAYGENSWSWRTDNWSRMLPYAFERPVAGNGFASYKPLTVQEFGVSNPAFVDEPEDGALEYSLGVSAHNDYVKLAVETGFLGMALWIAALIGLAIVMWRARSVPGLRPYATAAFALVVAWIVMGVADTQQDWTEVMLYLMAIVGGVAGVASRASQTHPSEPPRPAATG